MFYLDMEINIKIKVENFKDEESGLTKEFVRIKTTKPMLKKKKYPKDVSEKIFESRREAQEFLADFLGDVLY